MTRALLIGKEPGAELGFRYVSEPPYDAVMIGSLSIARLLRFGEERVLEAEGLFISIGRKPATGLVRGQIALDSDGYVIAGEDTATSLPGVFAVGDLRTKELRQIVTAVADGAMAVHMAEEYLAGR